MGLRPLCLLLSLPPGLFWLWYVWGKARLHPPPRLLVGCAVLLGALSPLGVLAFDDYINTHPIPWISSMTLEGGASQSLIYFVVIVGCVEETCKMLAVRLTVFYSRTFDDPLHGVLYSSAAALGFATVENARYVDAHGAEVMIGRAIMSTFGHVLLSMVWGFAIGAQRTRTKKGVAAWLGGWILLAASVLLAGLLHGLYDDFLFQNHMGLALLLLFTLWRVFLAQTELAARRSPHRPVVARRMRECSSCRALVRSEGRFCGSCGTPLEQAGEALSDAPGDRPWFCSSCGKTLMAATSPPDCPHCGLALR
jgi:RsiW-degrading membrane proteinase PrsW (M82 family)